MLVRRLWLTSLPLLSFHSLLARANIVAEPFPPALQYQSSAQSLLTTSTNMTRAPVISISHGGGPMPLLDDPSHAQLVRSLQTRVPQLLRLGTADAPRAIVLVTAHWSERRPTVTDAERPGLLFDYHGFPPEAYRLKYAAPGSPEVAREVFEALKEAGLEPEVDGERGWDHGVFVPLLLIHPSATIPVIQLSVLSSESPSTHYAMGRALSSLRASNVAIIGSGFASFHNLRIMFSPGRLQDRAFLQRNAAWNAAVTDAVTEKDEAVRGGKLERWREWPGSYEMHPRGGAEHFLPLVVCAGAAGRGKGEFWTDEFLGLPIYSYHWT